VFLVKKDSFLRVIFIYKKINIIKKNILKKEVLLGMAIIPVSLFIPALPTALLVMPDVITG
jgi:hypothetical protein